MSQASKFKAGKNVVYLAGFGISMLFAGLISAYVVLAKQDFWLTFKMPSSFYISTVLILLSSVALILAKKQLVENNTKQARTLVLLALLLGVGFGYYQFIGFFRDLATNNITLSSPLLVQDGIYGQEFTYYIDGKKIRLNGNTYCIGETPLTEEQWQTIDGLNAEIAKKRINSDITAASDKHNGMVYYQGQPIVYSEGKAYLDKKEMSKSDFLSWRKVADNMNHRMGIFVMKGEYGKDFSIYFYNSEHQHSELVQLKNNEFYIEDKPMTTGQLKLLNDKRAQTGAIFFVMVFAHLAHILLGIIILFVLWARLGRDKTLEEKQFQLQTGSIYWHFVDGLWVVLLLFFLFIH